MSFTRGKYDSSSSGETGSSSSLAAGLGQGPDLVWGEVPPQVKPGGGSGWWDRFKLRLRLAGRQTSYHYVNTPIITSATEKKQENLIVGTQMKVKSLGIADFCNLFSLTSLHSLIFGRIPTYYTFDRKLTALKNSVVGKLWDGFLVILSLVACGMYVAETYDASYHAVRVYFNAEVIVTDFFAIDFGYCFFASPDKIKYLFNPWSVIDMLTIIPVYITMAFAGKKKSPNLSIFRFVRILRLVRILRTFKLLGNMSGVKRQMITLSLTLISLVFMAAGIVQIFECDLRQQMEFNCNFINEFTDWEPSCSAHRPFEEGCDCKQYFCKPSYNRYDREGEPSAVNCDMLTFMNAFYFMIVTISSVGYGDFSPSTAPSKMVVVIFIVTSFAVIPQQLNEVTRLMSLNSVYRQPYHGGKEDEEEGQSKHVMVCGHTSDHTKIEEFLKEFFNPNHLEGTPTEFDVVILSPAEPSDNLKAVMNSAMFDSRVYYIIGSALSNEDLAKAGAKTATAMFFLCNSEAGEVLSKLDDAATVLRTLSVNDFNPNLRLFAQVLKSEDREILKESNIDVILCLDEYKTALQARNSICPGLSTLVENLFHTFGGWEEYLEQHNPPGLGSTDQDAEEEERQPWETAYLNGADKEVYYVPLDKKFLEMLKFEWSLIQEAIYIGYNVIALGVACPDTLAVILNPTKLEISPYGFSERFYTKYRTAIVLADDQDTASRIAFEISDVNHMNRLIDRLIDAEDTFGVRRKAPPIRQKDSQSSDRTGNSAESPTPASTSDHESEMSGLELGSPSRRERRSSRRSSKIHTNLSERLSFSPSDSTSAFNENTAPNKFVAFKHIINESKNRSDCIDVSKYLGHDNEVLEEEQSAEIMVDLQELRLKSHRKQRADSPNHHDEVSAAMFGVENSPKSAGGGGGGGKRSPPSFMRGTPLVKENSAAALSTVGEEGFHAIEKTEEASFAEQLRMLLGLHAHQDALDDLVDANMLSNHVVVFGAMHNLPVFIAELRRPLMVGSAYHPILIMDEEKPQYWDAMSEAYSDLFFMKGTLTHSHDFNRANIVDAFSLVLLADRDSISKVEADSLDSYTLFAYLRLEKYIPRSVFFTVELSCVSTMAVMNSSILRRLFSALMSEYKTKVKGESSPSSVNETMNFKTLKMSNLDKSLDNDKDMDKDKDKGKVKPAAHDKGSTTFASQRKRKNFSGGTGIRSMDAESEKDGKGKEAKEAKNEAEKNKKKSAPVPINGYATSNVLDENDNIDDFSGGSKSHHELPVFASGRAFVPHTFDSLLCQCFFSIYTPQLVEKLVCGQKYQSLYQIPCPAPFLNRSFQDLFRAFSSRQVTVLALYVHPNFEEDRAILPYVVTCPPPDLVLKTNDKLFVYCNPVELSKSLKSCLLLDHIQLNDGRAFLHESRPQEQEEVKGSPSRRKGAGFSGGLNRKPSPNPKLMTDPPAFDLNSLVGNKKSKPSVIDVSKN